MKVSIHLLPHAEGMPLPDRATPNSAGMDLRAALPEGELVVLLPGDRFLVPTGLIMAIPEGYEGQVRPRSGLALKHGVTVLNSPGTIDSDYRNEVGVLLINHGQAPFEIKRGDRVAQLLISPVPECS
jgi:dUTP pyrophosphatase